MQKRDTEAPIENPPTAMRALGIPYTEYSTTSNSIEELGLLNVLFWMQGLQGYMMVAGGWGEV